MSTAARLLIVGGESARPLAQKLTRHGFDTMLAPPSSSGAAEAAVDAVIVTGPFAQAKKALAAVESLPSLSGVPVLGLLDGGSKRSFDKLDLDAVVDSIPALEKHLEAAVAARRLRRRTTSLLELAQVMTSTLNPEHLAVAVIARLEAELPAIGSLVIVHGATGTAQRISQTGVGTSVEIAATAWLQRAIATRAPVVADDVVVQPLLAADHVVGALSLTLSSPLDEAQREWLQSVAGLLGPVLRNVLEHQTVARTQRVLEQSYVERFRELTAANDRLKKADQLKDELLSIASHDVRSPLQVLMGHARLLLDDETLTAPQRESVEMTVKMSKKVLELMEGLLERDAEGFRLQLLQTRRFDVAELCQQVVFEMQVLARAKGLVLKAETPESVVADGDPVKLRQVVQNFVGNAIEHANAAGNVVVRVQRLKLADGDVVRIIVEDDGEGLPSEWLPVLFDRYRSPARGRGLFICRELAELHGGDVWAEAAAPRGARFICSIPAVRERKGPGADRPVVLVVDDERAWRDVVSMALAPHFHVEQAADGVEGYKKALALAPALIVSDTFMPNLDGLQLFARLKDSPELKQTPVILMSGDHTVLDKLKAVGPAAVFAKPFDLPAFVHHVDELVRRTASTEKRVGHDAHTGLFDHVGLVRRLDQELSRAQRYGRSLSVIAIEPDRDLGPNEVPVAAAAVARTLRMPDLVAHLGHGTFVLVLPETSYPGAQALSGRLLGLLSNVPPGHTWRTHTRDLRDWRQGAAALIETLLP